MFPIMVYPDIADSKKYLQGVGMDAGWKLASIIHWGERPDSLTERPCAAVIVQFPDVNPQATTQDLWGGQWLEAVPEDLYFMQQGDNPGESVAFIHALANNKGKVTLDPSSPLCSFLSASESQSPEQRGTLLSQNQEMTAVFKAAKNVQEEQVQEQQQLHQGDQGAEGGQERRRNNVMACHSVAIINYQGRLILLDGRKRAPVQHGHTSEETFLKDAADIAQCIQHRSPMDLFFMTDALVPHKDGDMEGACFSL